MIFNGIEKDYIRVLAELFRPPSPPIVFETMGNSKYGTRVRRKKYMDVTLPVPVRLYSKQRIELLKEDMADWLIHNEPKKLIFKDNPNRYYLAYYEGMELNEKANYAKGYINFYLPEAYRFGEGKLISVNTQLSTHIVTGQVEVPWIVEVSFTEAKTKFEFEGDNGLYLLLNYEFVPGDRLSIHMRGRKVFLNGQDLRRVVSMKSNFVELQPGPLSVKSSQNCALKYDERFY